MAKKFKYPLFLDDDPILPKDAKPEDFELCYDKRDMKKAYLVECTEEVSKEYQRDIERDKKRLQRQMQKAEKEGETYAPPLSYDSLTEYWEAESIDAANKLDFATMRIAFEELLPLLEKDYPEYAKILRMTYAGATRRRIAAEFGDVVSGIQYKLKKAIKIFQQLMDE